MTMGGGGDAKAPPPSEFEHAQTEQARAAWEEWKNTYRPREQELISRVQSFSSPQAVQTATDKAAGAVGGQVGALTPTGTQSLLGAATERSINAGATTAEAVGGATLEPYNRRMRGLQSMINLGRGLQETSRQSLSSSAEAQAANLAASRGLSDYGKSLRAQHIGSVIGMGVGTGLSYYSGGGTVAGGKWGSSSPQSESFWQPTTTYSSGGAKTYGLNDAPAGQNLTWR